MTAAALSIDALRSAVERLPEDALMATRLDALEHLKKYGLPTTRHEDWKYTDLTCIVDISNRWLADGATIKTAGANKDTIAAIDAIREAIDAHWLVVADGVIVDESPGAAELTGLTVTRLSESNRPSNLMHP